MKKGYVLLAQGVVFGVALVAVLVYAAEASPRGAGMAVEPMAMYRF